ncbi:MAG: S8 family serine peptidase, partial [Gammaproteobacteria bacterium]|nr:S8 family serine peptidase [Gammaproteobacteria bacterium]
GYSAYSGTSMAAPHVTGVIAQLCDRWSYLRNRPATTASLLMATAITKDNIALSSPSATHLDNYGAGRVNSYKAFVDNSEFGVLINNTMNLTAASGFQSGDFTVTPEMTRIVVVMHYVEPASSAGAGSALVNDWDLWIDADPLTASGNSGEYFAQQSSLDNTEIRIINNPNDGPWRWKAYPDSVTGPVKMSVTVHAIYADTTPIGTLVTSVDDSFVQPGDNVEFTVTASNPDYIASGVFLDQSGSAFNLHSSSTTLDDGTVTDLLDNFSGGLDITLGDIFGGESRTGTWVASYPTEGLKTFSIGARSDNWADRVGFVNVTVDGTPPLLPTGLTSTSHTPNVWSNDPTIDLVWNHSTDVLSGVGGYGDYVSTLNPGLPSQVADLGLVNSTTIIVPSTLPTYYNLRPFDRSGNWNAGFVNAGPFLIDTTAPSVPSSLSSSTHSINTPDCDGSITMNWVASTDSASGVSGYSVLWSHSSSATPSTFINTTGTTWSSNLGASASGWYFHVRTRDAALNWSSTATSGPYFIINGGSTNYCVGTINSTGSGASMNYTGSLSVASNSLVVGCGNLPANQTCIFFYGANQPSVPFGNGFRCVGGTLFRYSPISTGSGNAQQSIDITSPPSAPGQITAGSFWNFQCWYRDPAAGGAFFNLSDGIELQFCP